MDTFLETGILAPQAGPQERFAATPADIAFYGGAAFGGKTMALLMEPLRHVKRPGFGATIFRRTYPEIFKTGGLWDTSEMFYPLLGGVPRKSEAMWHWPKTGATVKMSHMQHEKDKFTWQSSQLPLLEFDELTHFSESVFWYLISRNRLGRPMGGLRPYVRAAMNPDCNSWVGDMISWWIDQDTGFPITARGGVLRWFVRVNGEMRWADSREELEKYGKPKSFTFIPSRITDNAIGMDNDPSYIANLEALPSFERAQLLDGNWKVTPGKGSRFKRHWFKIVDASEVPVLDRTVRYWDRASTEISEKNKDPDRTAGVKQGKGDDGYFYILDVRREALTPGGVKRLIKNTAAEDGDEVEPWLEQDPAQAGVAEREDYAVFLAEHGPRFKLATGSKWVRSGPLSAAAENGRVRIVKGKWNKAFLDELEGFQDPDQLLPGEAEGHDDQVDGASGGFNIISRGVDQE